MYIYVVHVNLWQPYQKSLPSEARRVFSDNYYNYYCFFHWATTKLTEAITMIQMRRSGVSSEVLHPHHSVLKQIKLFGSDSQPLEVSTCHHAPFCSISF